MKPSLCKTGFQNRKFGIPKTGNEEKPDFPPQKIKSTQWHRLFVITRMIFFSFVFFFFSFMRDAQWSRLSIFCSEIYLIVPNSDTFSRFKFPFNVSIWILKKQVSSSFKLFDASLKSFFSNARLHSEQNFRQLSQCANIMYDSWSTIFHVFFHYKAFF